MLSSKSVLITGGTVSLEKNFRKQFSNSARETAESIRKAIVEHFVPDFKPL